MLTWKWLDCTDSCLLWYLKSSLVTTGSIIHIILNFDRVLVRTWTNRWFSMSTWVVLNCNDSMSTRTSLSLNFLFKTALNTINNNPWQPWPVVRLLWMIWHTNNLKHLELSNLQNVTGRDWLPDFRQVELQTVNLSSCLALNPHLLCAGVINHIINPWCREIETRLYLLTYLGLLTNCLWERLQYYSRALLPVECGQGNWRLVS
jgi:hypothetical protein